jgi:hypothetical protein
VSEGDDIQHKNLEEIYPLRKIETSQELVKVSYVAREPGVYKVTWSNAHSWFKAKTLMYRILVLKPEVIAEEPASPTVVRKEDPRK